MVCQQSPATITHIGNYANGLIVFATNGVWAITGSNRQYFTANNYGVRKISGIGTPSGASVVDYKGLPIWWGESGIYGLKHDPNYDAFDIENLTLNTIFSFIYRRVAKAAISIARGFAREDSIAMLGTIKSISASSINRRKVSAFSIDLMTAMNTNGIKSKLLILRHKKGVL
jgi:hypothetical protein